MSSCLRCNGSVTGYVCEYCGALAIEPGDAMSEKEALDQFHNILLTKELEVQEKMLKNGFLPDSLQILIEAGLRCVPYLDLADTANPLVMGAAGRLKAIILKLKIMPASKVQEKAILEFEEQIRKYVVADQQLTRWGLLLIGIIGLFVCGAIAYFMM